MPNKLDEGLREILDAHAIFSQNYLGRKFDEHTKIMKIKKRRGEG